MENNQINKNPPLTTSMTPLASARYYRWSSVTAAQHSLSNLSSTEPENFPISEEECEMEPWKGDTWRMSVPRGRTLDLVAAFDQCARYEQFSSRRVRRNSEPMMGIAENEEHLIKDVTFEGQDNSAESDEPTTVKIRREPEKISQRPSGDHHYTVLREIQTTKTSTPPCIDMTPKRPNTLNTRKLIPSALNMAKLDEVENLAPEENKENLQSEFAKNPNYPPKFGRRGTQAIVFKSSPIEAPLAPAETRSSHVRLMAHEFEEISKNRPIGRKIDAKKEISDLKRHDENQNLSAENSENNEVTDGAEPKKLKSNFKKQRSGIQMGVSVAKYKQKAPEDVIPPTRGGPSQKTFVPSPESRRRHQHEKTADQIDEMFDFGKSDSSQNTEFEEFGEVKTLDRTMLDGNTETLKMAPSSPENKFPENEKITKTPKFTCSPILVTPHAGLPVTEYRVSDKEGSAQKIIVHKPSPVALATSTPKGTLAARDYEHNSFVSSISNFSAVDRSQDSRRQIAKVIDAIDKTRRHIQLAELSLIDAKKSHLVVQELASQRVLLICRERLKLQLDEIRRLQALAVVRHPPPPINRHFKSTMLISNISLQLNRNFNARGSFAFIALFKCRTEVEASGVVTLLAHYQTRVHVIQFGEHIHFSNLPVDFVIAMEVYMMRVPEYKAPEMTCAAYLAEKVRHLFVPKRAVTRRASTTSSQNINRTSISLPGSQPPPDCEFKFCGKLTLDRDSSGDRNFLLDDVTYPLEGTVRLQSACSSLPEAIDVEYRGHLFLFHEQHSGSPPMSSSGGFATWHRYWALLHRGVVFFWNAESDEQSEQIPIFQIDLTKCTNQSIEETQTKSTRNHEFHIELLIDQTPSLLEKRRVVLAAESPEDLASWLNAINDTIFILRS